MDMISYTNASSAATLQSGLRAPAMNAESQTPSHTSSNSGPLPGYTCLFSQLSGELRNRIYDCIAEDVGSSAMRVHYNPDPAMPFQERYPKHKYMGLTQVDRKSRKEFAPLYINGHYFHFSQLAHFYRSGLAGKNDAYPALVRLLSMIKKGRLRQPAAMEFDSPNPGLDVTLLFRLDPYNGDVTGRWFLDTEYKTHRNGLITGVLVIVAGEEARGVKLHRKRRGRSQHSKHSLRDRHPSRQFLGLAQTNQLFRSEFWPLYTKAHRPIINIEELAEYLEVVPHSDEYINSSIITTLKAVRLLKTPKAVEAPGIDIRPLFRMKWKSFPFIVTKRSTYRYCEEHEIFHWLVNISCRRSRTYNKVLRDNGVVAIYLHRRHNPVGVSPAVEDVITVRLSDIVNMMLSGDRVSIFQSFVDTTRVLQMFGLWSNGVIECTSGMQKMVARKGQTILVEQLEDISDDV
ncbi:hypothetical protein J4E80_002580 [Alternaria sp. BMP 0032]|nr:hypothetical protein J4E80_002580 [Alternaria sp. BMP 0032]